MEADEIEQEGQAACTHSTSGHMVSPPEVRPALLLL